MRIGLASLPHHAVPDHGLAALQHLFIDAAAQGVDLICTPENFLPGMRGVGLDVGAWTGDDLARAETALAAMAGESRVGAIIGVERPVTGGRHASALVIGPDGSVLGYQDKVQVDPAEDALFVPGDRRQLFELAGVPFGVAICHEGWRYPETVRWAARRGARIVFHLQYSPAAEQPLPDAWAPSEGTMHEKAAICRAAENHVFFATVNFAIPNCLAGTALIGPEGQVIARQKRGQAGLLIADVDSSLATGRFAARLREAAYS
ncbi:carbon-nitrogen hydrolase family protein [Sphingosinicella sp. BN140058]|uniref:carbon-nitrogen hydrolase family protein n=1 Tax=Sphingosinicella sp. BN140058 TaxID=1892855 RepID=UPI001011FC3E|nr:carbon-nitrogen hydrolase family protein [Sphingosinicella sp. BN140058]QAY79217.1 carbon-nitrogen hydrolase family protein [Sphingosinicella sp. BN140058]